MAASLGGGITGGGSSSKSKTTKSASFKSAAKYQITRKCSATEADEGVCIAEPTAPNGDDASSVPPYYLEGTYPVLLSMHGSGIPATNHADAHKMMPPGKVDYLFGVSGYIIVAPSRFGAHNWEAVGEMSARQAIYAVQDMLRTAGEILFAAGFTAEAKASSKGNPSRTPSPTVGHSTPVGMPLPQLRLGSGLVSGHSMGAHGAWMAALNSPDLFSCLAPLSGWINKEEYSNSNAFFELDIGNSYVDPELKAMLEMAMSEFHSDKMIPNVLGMDVHLRVGANDLTTHAWFSRRMRRLLLHYGVNATLEELPGKQHWWWDTNAPNDGGVMNDPAMRAYYQHCMRKARKELTLKQKYVLALNSSTAPAAIDPLHHKATERPTYNSDIFTSAPHPSKGKNTSSTPADLGEVQPLVRRPCERNMTLVVVNPASHHGSCGLHIQQQHRMMRRTAVQVSCSPLTSAKNSASSGGDASSADAATEGSAAARTGSAHGRFCSIVTSNVRKLRLQFGYDSVLFGARYLDVDGVAFDLAQLHQLSAPGRPGSDQLVMDLPSDSVNRGNGGGTTAEGGISSSPSLHSTFQQRWSALHHDDVDHGKYMPGKAYFEVCWHFPMDEPQPCWYEADALVPPSSPRQTSTATDGNAAVVEEEAVTTALDGTSSASVPEHQSLVPPPSQQPQYLSSFPIAEKRLENYGPIRHVYARPFVVVYGTPPHQALRNSMRDLAVYIGNSHAAAHGTYVQVVSDLEYRASGLGKRTDSSLANILFVGGSSMNKVMALMCGTAGFAVPKLADVSRNSSYGDASGVTDGGEIGSDRGMNKLHGGYAFDVLKPRSSALPLICNLPGGIRFSGGARGGMPSTPNASSKTAAPSSSSSSSSSSFSSSSSSSSSSVGGTSQAPLQYSFELDFTEYHNPDHAVAFTFPFYRTADVAGGNGVVRMGVCIHANSAQGYLQLSRLAWPVIPPMVRAPFGNYMPDFMAVDSKLWATGFGGVLAAGYWSNQWEADSIQTYTNMFPYTNPAVV